MPEVEPHYFPMAAFIVGFWLRRYSYRSKPAPLLGFGLLFASYVHVSSDAGTAMMERFNADVSDNSFDNKTFGIRMSVV